LSRAPEFPALLDTERAPEQDEFEITINRAVAATLCLPPPILEALEIVWRGFVASPPVTLGDTVALAKELAPFESPFVRMADSKSIAPIDMVVGDESLAGILQEAAEEVASLTRALVF